MSRRRGKRREKAEGAKLAPEATAPTSRRYRIGRLLQFIGLLILPFGIASELVGKVGLGKSLLIAGGGALLFYAGYVIQHGEDGGRGVSG